MDKRNLNPGRKYLHHRKVIIDGRIMEAERWDPVPGDYRHRGSLLPRI